MKYQSACQKMSHASSPRSGMLNRKFSVVSSLVCTLRKSNIAITILHCYFEFALVWKQFKLDCVLENESIDQWFSNSGPWAGSGPPSLSIRPARLCCFFLFLIIFMAQYETWFNLITFCVHTTAIKSNGRQIKLTFKQTSASFESCLSILLHSLSLMLWRSCVTILWLHCLLSFRYVLKHMGLEWLQ